MAVTISMCGSSMRPAILIPQALHGRPDVFWYDGTLPVSTSIVTPTLPATGWYTGSVSMSFSATDLPVDPAYSAGRRLSLDSAPRRDARRCSLV